MFLVRGNAGCISSTVVGNGGMGDRGYYDGPLSQGLPPKGVEPSPVQQLRHNCTEKASYLK